MQVEAVIQVGAVMRGFLSRKRSSRLTLDRREEERSKNAQEEEERSKEAQEEEERKTSQRPSSAFTFMRRRVRKDAFSDV